MISHIFITPIILIAVSLALFFGFVKKEFEKNRDLKKEITVYEDALEKAKELKNKRDVLQRKLTTIGEENLNDLEIILPDSVDTVRMVMDISGIASREGIVIKNIDISDPNKLSSEGREADNDSVKERKGFGELSLSFDATTTYERFTRFLRDLEESLRILDVSGITVKETDTAGIYEFSVSAKTYWLK